MSAMQSEFTGRDLREVLDSLPVAIAVNQLDESGTILFVNEHFVRLFGYTTADIPTVPEWARRAYPDADYRREVFGIWDAAVARARRENGRIESMELRVTCKNGSVRDATIGAVVSRDQLIVTLTDITERRQVERQLRTVREELEQTAYELTENIPVGTYTMVQPPGGGMGVFSFMSERFLEICGLEREAARSDPFKAFACVHPDDYDEWVRKNADVFEKKLPFFGECRVVVGEDVRWIAAESRPRGLPDGSTVWEGVLIDITRQKRAEGELARARALERQSEQAHRRELEQKLKTSLTAAAAVHEIKQPLSKILLETQLAIERMRGRSIESADMQGYLEGMLAESRHIVDMIGRMKALLRNVQSEHRPFDLADVVTSAILYSEKLLADHAVTLRDVGGNGGIRMNGDAGQVQTAVINLIRNAVEAVAGQPEGSREILVELQVRDGTAEIIVGDNGPGMSNEQISRLPFETTKPDGTGLGLYLVRACAENHGGRMKVGRSRLGGAEVRITIPCVQGMP